jgi:sugar fermentation stimulation protein A
MVAAGARAVMVYLIHRDDCERLSFAGDLDPGYRAAFLAAQAAGVEAIALVARVALQETLVTGRIPILP